MRVHEGAAVQDDGNKMVKKKKKRERLLQRVVDASQLHSWTVSDERAGSESL
jgi:hypothetical protein